MIKLKLTAAQRSAVEIYVTDPAHADDYPEASLAPAPSWHSKSRTLVLACDVERARDILIDACNSADAGDGRAPDRGAALALSNLTFKLREVVK